MLTPTPQSSADAVLPLHNRYAPAPRGQSHSLRQVAQNNNSYTDEELFTATPLDYAVQTPPKSMRIVKARVVSRKRGSISSVNLEEL